MLPKCHVCGGNINPNPMFPYGGSLNSMCQDCNMYQQERIRQMANEPTEEERLRKRQAYFNGAFGNG